MSRLCNGCRQAPPFERCQRWIENLVRTAEVTTQLAQTRNQRECQPAHRIVRMRGTVRQRLCSAAFNCQAAQLPTRYVDAAHRRESGVRFRNYRNLASVNKLIPLKKRGLSAIRTLHEETAGREFTLGFDAEKAIVSRSFGVHRDLCRCEIFCCTQNNPKSSVPR